MRLNEIYKEKLQISFEMFPEENISNVYNVLAELKKYNPSLVSLTYGAGGKNKEFSKSIVREMKSEYNLMPHFTCICNSKENVENDIINLECLGIKNILALRGDMPDNNTVCYMDFKHANDLVAFIKSKTDLSIGVAGYPEGHIESPDLDTDLKYLKQKVETGADVIYTQLFFNNDKFYSFVEKVRKMGIDKPVIPGVMPIISQKQVNKMTNLARIEVPKIVREKLEKYSTADLKEFGVEYAFKQCEGLIDFGVKGLHFYTLNKSYSTSKILDNILN